MAKFSVPPNASIPLDIAHEDDWLLVVEKPAGLVTQPGKGHEDDTLLSALFARYGQKLQNLGAARDFGLLHRLDRETSGLLVVALRAEAYDALRRTFAGREVRKFYWAVVARAPAREKGVIRRPIQEFDAPPKGRDRTMRLARISSGGKESVTAYRVVSASNAGALLECRPVTGRLHQVRVHLESIGCPILGDGLYAPPAYAAAAPRLALHSHRLAFSHPLTGAAVDVRSDWPGDLKGVLKTLRLPRPRAGGDGE